MYGTWVIGRNVKNMEKNSILLTFDNNDERYNFVNAAVNRDGDISELNMFTHTGLTSDSVLIYDGEDVGAGEIDIRYFTAASRGGKYIEFYSFFTDDLPVYLQNAGETSLTFLTSSGLVEISPGHQLMIP